MYDRNVRRLDQAVRKASVLVWYLVAPIRPPMYRHDDNIVRLPNAIDLSSNVVRRC